MKRKPHLYDGTVTVEPDKNMLVGAHTGRFFFLIPDLLGMRLELLLWCASIRLYLMNRKACCQQTALKLLWAGGYNQSLLGVRVRPEERWVCPYSELYCIKLHVLVSKNYKRDDVARISPHPPLSPGIIFGTIIRTVSQVLLTIAQLMHTPGWF